MTRFALTNPAMTWVASRTPLHRAHVDCGRVRRFVAPAVATAAGAGIAGVLVLSRSLVSEHPGRVVLQVVVVGVPVVGGVVARRSSSTRRFGAVLVAVGLIGAFALLARSPYSVPYSVGRVIGWLLPVLVVYLMLVFPQGRLAPGRERALFGAIVIVVGLLYVGSALFVEAYPRQAPWASCDADCPPNAFLVLHDEPAIMSSVVEHARETLAILLLGAVTLVLVQRVRSASALRRRTLAPVAAAGLVASASLTGFLVVRQAAPHAPVLEWLGVLWAVSIAAIAAAFLVALVRRRLLIASVLGRLSMSLAGPIDATRLRAALAAALGDETLELRVLAAADRKQWISADPRRSGARDAGRRATLQIDDGGSPVALLSFDDALCADDELLDAVAAQTRNAVARMRDTTELQRSRSRIAAVATQERARIERDLHDGAQQRLIALRIKLALAEELLRTDPDAAAQQIHELGPEIELALEELRALAHGIYPPLLADRGIEAALRSAIRESPLPVHLRADGVTRQPPEIESALYFTCLEALQNAAKHAHGATGVWISLHENGALSLEIRDNGAGFLPPPAGFTGGLRNMTDRIEATGGHLMIDSAPGRGTRLTATIALP